MPAMAAQSIKTEQQPTNEKATECYDRAGKARQRASDARTPAERAEWITQEDRWLKLAENYEVAEGVLDFLNDSERPSVLS